MRLLRGLLIFVLVWLCIPCMPAPAQVLPPNAALIADMSDAWLVYERDNYLPFITPHHTKADAVSFWLSLSDYHTYHLWLKPAADSYLFINRRLVQHYASAPEGVLLHIDSLQRLYGNAPIFLTVYNDAGKFPLEASAVVKQDNKTDPVAPNSLKIATRPKLANEARPEALGGNMLVICFLLLLLSHTALWNFQHKIFRDFYHPATVWAGLRAWADRLNLVSPFVVSQVLFMFNHACTVVFCTLMMYLLMPPDSFWSLLLWLGQQVLILMLLMWGKWLLLQASGKILGQPMPLLNYHYWSYIHLNSLFYLLWAALSLHITWAYPAWRVRFFGFAPFVLLIFHLCQSTFVSIGVIRQSEHRNLYLFYYLCISEAIPLLIGVKWLLI